MPSPKDRDLSLALIGLAASLLVGNFAAYNGYLGVAAESGDSVLTGLLVICTLLLTLSVLFGGWGISTENQKRAQQNYNAQSIFGLLGLLAVLSMPVVALGHLPDETADPTLAVVQKAVAALIEENAELSAEVHRLREDIRSAE